MQKSKSRILFVTLCLVVMSAHAHTGNQGEVFKDCADCPEMVMIPEGGFDMGWASKSTPGHRVTIAKPFAIGQTEVTREQWFAVMGSKPGSRTVYANTAFGLCRYEWQRMGMGGRYLP